MKVRFFRNTSAKRWWHAKLPHRIDLFWLGPIFILVSR